MVTFSKGARQTLRNVCESHGETVVRRLGRAALLAETELGAFLALRLREKHGEAVQVERTAPLNEFRDVPERVREAARDYERRESASTPYRTFAKGTDHPTAAEMEGSEL